MVECEWRHAWLAKWLLVLQSWASDKRYLETAIARLLGLLQTWQVARDRPFLRMWPKTRQLSSPRLVFMLIVTKLMQLMKVVDVMDELR